jgi:hypothetical protein
MSIPLHNCIFFHRGHWHAHLLVFRFIQRLDDFISKALHAVNCFSNTRDSEADVTEADPRGCVGIVVAGRVWDGRVGGYMVELQKAF